VVLEVVLEVVLLEDDVVPGRPVVPPDVAAALVVPDALVAAVPDAPEPPVVVLKSPRPTLFKQPMPATAATIPRTAVRCMILSIHPRPSRAPPRLQKKCRPSPKESSNVSVGAVTNVNGPFASPIV
jgi:hypothetical protein